MHALDPVATSSMSYVQLTTSDECEYNCFCTFYVVLSCEYFIEVTIRFYKCTKQKVKEFFGTLTIVHGYLKSCCLIVFYKYTALRDCRCNAIRHHIICS